MKKALYPLLIAAAFYSCNQTKPATDTPEAEATTAEALSEKSFGAAVTETEVIPAEQLPDVVAERDSVQATVSAEIVESCQAKGCWMDVKLAEDKTMKVTFRDYGFFVPVEDLKGRQVLFTGTAKREVVSVEDQRHYAQDAGKSEDEIAAITEPKEELRFVADGVVLK